jgi:hypothetical protein
VDVIVADWMGYALVHDSMVEAVVFARCARAHVCVCVRPVCARTCVSVRVRIRDTHKHTHACARMHARTCVTVCVVWRARACAS